MSTEVGTADRPPRCKRVTLDVSGSFQFNHIRLDRQYDYLLCPRIAPYNIWFNVWRKGEVAEGKAGRLVRMAESQSVTFKLTKRLDSMRSIEELPEWVQSKILNLALREFVGLWSGWLVVGFMLGGVLGRRSFGGL